MTFSGWCGIQEAISPFPISPFPMSRLALNVEPTPFGSSVDRPLFPRPLVVQPNVPNVPTYELVVHTKVTIDLLIMHDCTIGHRFSRDILSIGRGSRQTQCVSF